MPVCCYFSVVFSVIGVNNMFRIHLISVSKLSSVIAVIFHPVAVESKSESEDAVAKVLWPLLHPVQWVYHPSSGNEQYSASCHEDALQI